MKSTRHPNFILGIISFIIFFVGIGMRANSMAAGDYVLVGSIVLGAIHYIWSILDVSKTDTLQTSQRTLWLIVVICIPAAGSILYYILHSRRNQVI
jgi:Phospholipase_D-nuclease N-terminal